MVFAKQLENSSRRSFCKIRALRGQLSALDGPDQVRVITLSHAQRRRGVERLRQTIVAELRVNMVRVDADIPASIKVRRG